MSIVKHAVIAAAGLGSSLGLGKPKCLLQVNGVTVLEHQLTLLREVEDVRVVVGFEENAVIELVSNLRPDAIVVRNPAYRSTTTLHSYALGSQHLNGDCLYLDGEIFFEPSGFHSFLAKCQSNEPLIAVTDSKTRDAVYAEINDKFQIVGFSREKFMPLEWANLAWLPTNMLELPSGPVFERIAKYLPLTAKNIVAFEIDTAEDLEIAKKHHALFSLS